MRGVFFQLSFTWVGVGLGSYISMSLLPSIDTVIGVEKEQTPSTSTPMVTTTTTVCEQVQLPTKRLALAPLPLDKHGLCSDGAAYLHSKMATTSNAAKSSDRSSLFGGLFDKPLGVLEDSTHLSPRQPRFLPTSLDLNHSYQSSALNRNSVPGTLMHGPTQSDFSALWKSNVNTSESPANSREKPSSPSPATTTNNNLNNSNASHQPPTLPSPTQSLPQHPQPGRSSPSLSVANPTPAGPSATISLPLLSPPVPAVSTPSPSLPNASAPPVTSSLHSPAVSSSSAAPMLGLGVKSSVLPFVMASGMFDYGLGSMNAPNPNSVPVPAGSAAGVGAAAVNAATAAAAAKSGILHFPANMFGPPTSAASNVQQPPQTSTHLPTTSGSVVAVAQQQHHVPMNSMSAALVAAAAAQTWIPQQSVAMSSALPLNVSTNSIGVSANAVPPNLLVKQEPQPSGTTANGSWSLSNGSGLESVNETDGNRSIARRSRKRPRHAVEKEQVSEAVEEELKERCPLCPARLRTRVILQNHMRVVHKSGSEHRCVECSAEFPWKSTLDNHVRLVHRKERPFKCQRCDKAFRWSSHLQEHTWVVHEKKKPFKCDICDKAFGRKNNRTKHMRKVHNRET